MLRVILLEIWISRLSLNPDATIQRRPFHAFKADQSPDKANQTARNFVSHLFEICHFLCVLMLLCIIIIIIMVYYYNAISNWNWGDHSSSSNNTSTSWWVTCVRPDVRQYLNGQQKASSKRETEGEIERGAGRRRPSTFGIQFAFFLLFSRLLLKAKSFWGLPGFDVCQSYVRVKILSNLISINPPVDPGQPKGLLPNLINVANWFRLVMRSLGYILFGFSMAREKRANCKLAKRALQINVCSGFVSLPTY